MDGRCSRVAFANPEKFSEISGVPVDLIKDFDTLVVALCCGADISPEEFEKKAEDWLDRFHGNDDISWNVLSPTVHLVLHHGREILEACPIPPGLCSEEGAEHNNKVLRWYRTHHARQTSLKANLQDIFTRVMHGSDPEILYLIGASLIPDWSKRKTLPSALKDLLLFPEKFDFSDEAFFEPPVEDLETFDFDPNLEFAEVGAYEEIEMAEDD